jgi:acetyl esterase/lipase
MLVGSLEPHLDDCQRLAERLRSAGAHVKLDVIDGIGHDYPSDFAQRLPAAVEWVLGQDQ